VAAVRRDKYTHCRPIRIHSGRLRVWMNLRISEISWFCRIVYTIVGKVMLNVVERKADGCESARVHVQILRQIRSCHFLKSRPAIDRPRDWVLISIAAVLKLVMAN
jgi:hypothetical protein